MTTALVVLLALLRLVDPAPAELARVEAFAADVTRAVDAAPALPFTGPAAREATIAALLVTAWHESGIRQDVIDCRVRGDRGRSVSAFQLLGPFGRGGRSIALVCSSVEASAAAALEVLVRQSRCSPLGMWRGYSAGSCAVKSDASSEMCWAWAREAKRIGIVGASCDRRQPLTWATP